MRSPGRDRPLLGNRPRGLANFAIAIAVAGSLGAHEACARAASASAAATSATVVEVHYLMATPIVVQARGDDEERVREAVRASFGEIRRLEANLSTFDPDSDASRLNRSAGGDFVPVAADLADLIVESQRLTRATSGAFSVLVGPLVELWRRVAEWGRLPGSAAIATARRRADRSRLVVDGRRVALADPGMRLDLGGIAKGFAADRALSRLREGGATAGVVNLGGSSIAAFGDAGDGERGWPIELPSGETNGEGRADIPLEEGGERDSGAPGEGDFRSTAVLRLCDAALSTSSSLGRYSRVGSMRIGHVVDPRTGWPLTSEAVALVRHRSATVAEALSKSLLIDAGGAAAPLEPGADGMLLRPGEPPICSPGFRSEIARCSPVAGPERKGI